MESSGPGSRQPLAIWVGVCGILLLGVLLALGLLMELHSQLPRLAGFDASVMAWVHGWTCAPLTAVMLALTAIGGIDTFAIAAGIVVGLLIYRQRHHAAFVLGGALVGAFALNEVFKLHFHRLRPTVAWRIGFEPTFSFPSGHALFATILYGTLAYMAWHPLNSARRRAEIMVPTLLLPLGIGLSRIYLGMHFPTDVLGGYIAGLSWLVALIVADRWWHPVSAGDGSVAGEGGLRVGEADSSG